MNFKRIEVIFLVAFAILNAALLGSLLWGTHFQGASTQPQSQRSLTLKEMHNDMISYRPQSHQQRQGYYLSAKSSSLASRASSLHGVSTRDDDDILEVNFDHPIELKDEADAAQYLQKVVNNRHQVIDGKKYTYNEALSSKHQVVFSQQVKGQPFESKEGQIRFVVNDRNQVTGYKQGELSDLRILRPRDMTVSETSAVVWLYKHNQIPNNSRVNSVLFGYSKLTSWHGQRVLIPTWLVNVKSKSGNNNSQLKVNAFSGTQIKE
jgi:regulatory protein YycI of two-component signal transduction system YycFG